MTPLTERLLQLACVIVMLYVLWQGATQTIVTIFQLSNRAVAAEQQLAECRAMNKK